MAATARIARGSAVGVALLVGVAGCAQQLHDAAWDDLVTARQQDAIDREWVPEWMPEAATDLVEQNHPESGEVVLVARLPAADPLDACTPTDRDLPGPDLSPDWWQPALDGIAYTCDDDWSLLRDGDTLWTWTLGDTVVLEEPT